jgi:regulatory protein
LFYGKVEKEVRRMAVITKITVQKKQPDRYNIFTDDGNGERYALSVDEAVLIKY